MPAPFERNGIYYYRASVPRDVAAAAKGKQIVVEVAGKSVSCKIGQNLQVSLKTKDETEAKSRHHQVASQAAEYYQMLRDGPTQELSPRQVLVFAGDIRNTWVELFDEDPGQPARWHHVQAEDTLALSGRYGCFHSLQVPTEATNGAPLEARWGPVVDAYLAHRRLWFASEPRQRLVLAVAKAMSEMAEVNLKKSEGDYSPDVEALKYPKPKETADPATGPAGQRRTFTQVINRVVKERASGRDAKPMPTNSENKYRRAAKEFAAFRGDDDVSTVRLAEGNNWRLAMLEAQDYSNKTIRDRLTNLKTIIRWAIKQADPPVHSNGNPFSDITLPSVVKIPGDMKTYTVEEARQILKKARSQQHHAARWVPWLCAYTGARVSEITQTQPRDVYKISGHWFLRLTAMGGKSLKNSHGERRVPLHPDVISEGFIDWVLGLPDKDHRMFPVRTGDIVSQLIRDDLGIARDKLKPSHSWRHLFEDRCTGHGIPDDAKRYITGRSGGGSGTDYGKSQELLPGLAKEMQKFPSYLD